MAFKSPRLSGLEISLEMSESNRIDKACLNRVENGEGVKHAAEH